VTDVDTDVNVRALARTVITTSPAADPAVLAAELLDRIPAGSERLVLEQCLRDVVRQVIHDSRPSMLVPDASTPNKSWKVQGVRDAWQRALRDLYHVGPDASDWKRLADCTRDDLLFAAAERREHAARTLAKAEQLDRLAALVAEHGVERVADLPGPTLAITLADAA
jgi:hypothetical protein